MSVSLKEVCQVVNVPYVHARALIESESSDGEIVDREEATVVEDTVVHADRVYADGFHKSRHLLKKY